MVNTNKVYIKWYAPFIATLFHMAGVIIMNWINSQPSEESYLIDPGWKIYIWSAALIMLISYLYIVFLQRFSARNQRITHIIVAILLNILLFIFLNSVHHGHLKIIDFIILVETYLIPFFYILIRYNEVEKPEPKIN